MRSVTCSPLSALGLYYGTERKSAEKLLSLYCRRRRKQKHMYRPSLKLIDKYYEKIHFVQNINFGIRYLGMTVVIILYQRRKSAKNG